jgi:dynactin complex subunit
MALYYVDTIKSEQSKEIKADIIANLPTDLKLVGDKPTDPAAIHELRRMQVICDGLAEQLEATKAENEELKKQYESAEMSLLNTREQRADDMERFRISETNKMNLETAKLESQNAKAAAELAIKNKAVNADMQRAATEAEQAAVDTAEKIAGGENAV